MGNLGLGVMIHSLFGSSHGSDEYVGLQITAARFDAEDNAVFLEFGDFKKIKIYDNGQSCCEARYMVTDDDPSGLVGQKLVGIFVKDAPDITDEGGEVHEVQFLEIQGDSSAVTFANHNEHNGYYGGFALCIEEV